MKKKKEGSRMETTCKSQQFNKNKIISYTKLMGLVMKLMYQLPISLMLLVTVAEGRKGAMTLKSPEQEYISVCSYLLDQIAQPYLTSRKKRNRILLCSQKEIWKYLVNSSNDGHISNSQISDSGNVVVSLTEI